MKEELLAGLRNALDRGYSIDQAVQSFVNAGYNLQEVEEAALVITQGALSIVNPTAKDSVLTKNRSLQPSTQILPPQTIPGYQQGPDPYLLMRNVKDKNTILIKNKKRNLIVALTIILIILLAGIVCVLLFKDQITTLLT